MGLLLDRFREEVGENYEDAEDYAVPTEFTLFNYKNGLIVNPSLPDIVLVKEKKKKLDLPSEELKPYFSGGISVGSYNLFIGPSGSGKTTFTAQLAASLVDPYEQSDILERDLEGGLRPSRFRKLSGWSKEKMKSKFSYKNTGIYAETILDELVLIANTKKKLYNELLITTDKYDEMGNQVKFLAPTVYIIDTISLLYPRAVSIDDKSSKNKNTEEPVKKKNKNEILASSKEANNMTEAQRAKALAYLFRRAMGIIKEVNIILLGINHINTKIDVSMFAKKGPDINYLKQDEAIPGGKAPLQYANNLIKLTPGTKMSQDKDFEVAGFINKVELIKSRSNRAGQVFEIPLIQKTGYNNDLSLWLYLKDNNMIAGSGHGYYVKGYEEKKYKNKELIDAFKEDKDFRSIVHKEARKLLLKEIKLNK